MRKPLFYSAFKIEMLFHPFNLMHPSSQTKFNYVVNEDQTHHAQGQFLRCALLQ